MTNPLIRKVTDKFSEGVEFEIEIPEPARSDNARFSRIMTIVLPNDQMASLCDVLKRHMWSRFK
jgi:hypothetical protein